MVVPMNSPRIIDRRVWLYVLANVLVVVALLGYAAYTADQLPERYPAHFNAAGQPDRWAEAGSGEWYAVPGIGAGIALLMVILALGMTRIPLRLWNLPNKEKFLALSPRKQAPVIRAVVTLILVMSLMTGALFFGIQRAMFASALDARLSGSMLPRMVIFGVIFTGYLVWQVVRIRRMILDASADKT
jgi:uncharacterized membrane protein